MLATVQTISVDPIPFSQVLGRFAVAALLGGAIGFNADRSRRPAGMRLYATAGLTGAAIALTLTALLTIPMTYILFTISIPMAIAVMPYQIWVAIAAALNWSIRGLN